MGPLGHEGDQKISTWGRTTWVAAREPLLAPPPWQDSSSLSSPNSGEGKGAPLVARCNPSLPCEVGIVATVEVSDQGQTPTETPLPERETPPLHYRTKGMSLTQSNLQWWNSGVLARNLCWRGRYQCLRPLGWLPWWGTLGAWGRVSLWGSMKPNELIWLHWLWSGQFDPGPHLP